MRKDKQLYTCSDGIYRTIDEAEYKKVSMICEYNPENREWKEKRKKREKGFYLFLDPPRVFFPTTHTGKVWIE